MTLTKITDHAARAEAFVLSIFADSAKLKALLGVLTGEIQGVENVAYDVLTKTDLGTAEGVQLDQWGGLLRELRGDLTDDEYRAILNAAAAANQSDGDAVKTILIVSTLVGVPVRYIQVGRACYHLDWVIGAHADADWATRIKKILDRLPPAGVSYYAAEGLSTGNGAFRFDSGPGFDQGKLAAQVAP